ncbi:MAG: Calx-beta domain-containing protein [Saprospiraceae bacterium]
MPHISQSIKNQTLATFALLLAAFVGQAQNPFPTSGFTLPAGKNIVVTYEVTVNANACPTGTVPSLNLSNQSQVQGGNFPTVNTHETNPGTPDPTLTPFGGLTLGNLVYKDVNKDGDYDMGTDLPIDGVQLRLYVDDGDGVLDAGDGAHIATNTTAGGGLYAFVVCPGNYIVEVIPANFNSGNALYDNALMAALVSSPIGGATDPDNDVNDDDNGDPVSGFGVASAAITVAYGAEPDGADLNTNNRLDFGFKTPTTVTIGNRTLAEGTGGGPTAFNFTVTRSDTDGAFSLTVNTTGGTATSGTDFTAISGGTASFTAGGSLTATVTVDVTHDNIVEANETFTVNLSGAPAGVVITDGTGDGSITNDDAATVTLTGTQSQNEGNTASPTTDFYFTATLDNPVQGGFTIAYATNNGTTNPATAGSDYTDNDGTINFAGTASEDHFIIVQVPGDVTVELNETFTVTLGTITGAPAGVTAAGSPQTGTITNDDAATVSIAANLAQMENITPQAFSITLSNPVDVNVTVQFNTANITAMTGDNDYTGIVNQVVTFPAGTTTAQTVNVTVNNDNKVENNETYGVSIGSLSAGGRNVTIGSSNRTGNILNDDAATVTLTGGGSANEGNNGTTPRMFTATLNNPVQGGFTLAYTTSDGTATTADNDYVDNDGPALSFTGTASETQTITVLVNGDLNIEADETFTVLLGTITAPTTVQTNAISIAGTNPQTGTITNDEKDWGDAPDPTYPTLAASTGANHAAALGGLRLGATIDGDLNGQPNATATGDGADEDGVTLPASLITGLTANITVNASGTGNLNAWVDFNQNGTWESPGEQVFTNTALVAGDNALSFAVPGGATLGTSFARFRLSSATGLTPTGNAADGEVEDYQVDILSNSYSISSPMVTEGDAPGTKILKFIISRSDNTNAGSVDYSAPSGTASSGTDYQVFASGTANFTAGGDMSTEVSVTVNGDGIVEDNETVIITLSNPVGGGIGTGTGTGTITNDDLATLTLTGGATQNEGNASTVTYTFTATLNKAVQGGFQVAHTTGGGSATAGSDYTDNDGTLTFLGNIGETKSWTVDVSGDNTVELDETFDGTLGAITMTSTVQAAAISQLGSPQTATITNDDSAIMSIAAHVSQSEAITPQNFTVTLSNPVDVPVSAELIPSSPLSNPAQFGADFNGFPTVTFPANNNADQTGSFSIVNDNVVEANEQYAATLRFLNIGGRSVSYGIRDRTGTIQNDDAATVTLTGGVSQNEGNSGTTAYTFTATLNNPVQDGFTLAYTTNNGTATTADNDYVDNDGPALSFTGTANEMKTITVQVNGDNAVETDETFTVALGTVTALTPMQTAAISTAGSPKTGTITNDEVDWGDGPDSLPTILFMNGARHNTIFGFHLGASVDGETDGQATGGTHSNPANGDDTDADGDDEDGVTLPGAFVVGTTATVTVNASQAGKLDAFMDFNWNRELDDAGEKIFNNVALVPGDNVLSFAVPPGAVVGSSFIRFRFSSAGGLSHQGLAADGEVEDYRVEIVNTQFSIDDPTLAEGNSPGTSNLAFTISRNVNVNACSVDYAITGGTATSGTDYQVFASGTANFTASGAMSQPVTVTVIGDITVELDETVVMTLSNPVNASILDGTATGEITNDDQGVITISSPTVTEGNTGTVNATFNISMSNPADANVVLNYATQDGTAMLADNDFQNTAGSHTLTPGQTMKTVNVPVVGDCTIEPNEQFALRLSTLNPNGRDVIFSGSNPTLDGTGTINNDDALPEITCPPDAEYDTDPGQCNALITLPLPTLNSICGSNTLEWRGRQVDELNVPLQPYSMYLPSSNRTANFSKGRFEIEWKATDGSGTSTCSYFIEIVDNELPEITCPGPVTVPCSSNVPPVNLADVTATDNCPGVTKSHVGDATSNMTCANRKTVTRTYRATDASGNSTTCVQVITVFDNVIPVFTSVPTNVTVQCNSIPAVGSPAASDGCGGAVSIAYDGQTVSNILCTDKYTLTRKWTATDLCGNTKTATQRIVVTDTQLPNFTSTPANVTVQCNAIPAPATPTATDNCDASVAVTYNGQTTTAGSCPNAYTLTRRWTAADNCGNTRSISQRITVVDNVKPVFSSVPADGSISCSDPIPGVGTPTASDACGGGVTIAYLGQTTTSGTCPNSYQIKRTWRATDVCGNSTAATQIIQVSDGGVPVFTSTPGPLTIECTDFPPPLVSPTASDACGGYVHITFLGNVATGSGCAADYTITRTWRADDLCGNTATTSQVITVLGTSYGQQETENRAQEGGHPNDAGRPQGPRLRVQPNPTSDRVWLDLSGYASEAVTVSIFGDLGQLVWERRIPAVEDLKLSVSLREAGAAAGVYTLSVRSAGGVATKRVVLVD